MGERHEPTPEEMGINSQDPAKKEGVPPKPESFEPYRNPAWEQAKQRYANSAFMAIQEGVIMGVPSEVLRQFAQDVIARETEKGDWSFVYSFQRGLGMGTPE